MCSTLAMLLARPTAGIAAEISKLSQMDLERRAGLIIAIAKLTNDELAINSAPSSVVNVCLRPAVCLHVAICGSGFVASGAALAGSLQAKADVLLRSWHGQSILRLCRLGAQLSPSLLSISLAHAVKTSMPVRLFDKCTVSLPVCQPARGAVVSSRRNWMSSTRFQWIVMIATTAFNKLGSRHGSQQAVVSAPARCSGGPYVSGGMCQLSRDGS
jgi:hypothetical protein